jgi:hypothetical protein
MADAEDPRIARLQERFPSVPKEELVDVLGGYNGHVGKATTHFQSKGIQRADAASQERPGTRSPAEKSEEQLKKEREKELERRKFWLEKRLGARDAYCEVGFDFSALVIAEYEEDTAEAAAKVELLALLASSGPKLDEEGALALIAWLQSERTTSRLRLQKRLPKAMGQHIKNDNTCLLSECLQLLTRGEGQPLELVVREHACAQRAEKRVLCVETIKPSPHARDQRVRRLTKLTVDGAECALEYMRQHPKESLELHQSGGGFQSRERMRVDPADPNRVNVYIEKGMTGQTSSEETSIDAVAFCRRLANVDPEDYTRPGCESPQDWAVEVAMEREAASEGF